MSRGFLVLCGFASGVVAGLARQAGEEAVPFRDAPARRAPAEPCPACPPEAPAPSCEAAREVAVMRQMEALDAEYGAPDVVAALAWPLSPVAAESPELATRLADDFAARCLPPDAFYTIRCDEYPCVLGYDMTDLIDERCGEEQWSEADFRYTMSATSRLRGMFLAPPGADATWIEEVRATRRRRLSAILEDRVHHFNARVWPTLETRSD